MIGAIARKLFGSSNERRVKTYFPRVAQINALEKELEALSDEELRARTDAFKQQVAEGASLDDILVPAFATLPRSREANIGSAAFRRPARRRYHPARGSHFRDEDRRRQDAGSHACSLPQCAGRARVHVVTVNDYLARRDAEWMGQIYNFLGLKVGVIVHGLDDEQRKQAYDADVTYGTNNELGFDYLRDNMNIAWRTWSSAGTYSPLSTKWTPSWSTRRERR